MTAAERVSTFIHDLRLAGDSIPKRFNDWLQKLPTVQFQAVISAMLAFGTALWYWGMEANDKDIDGTNFIAWLAFVAAYGGIAYARPFAKKRETYDPLNKPSEQNRPAGGEPQQ